MTNDKEKDLKKEFHKWYFDSEGEPDKELLDAHIKWLDEVFDFFYSEIEARENTILITQGALQYQRERTKSQEAIIQAADEVVETLHQDRRPNWVRNTDETYEALEKYTSLKEKNK